MTTHLQVPNLPPRIQYTGNGSQTAFTYPFPIFDAAHLHVSLNGAQQLVGFAVSGMGVTSGGSVTFDTAPASGVVITLERVLPLQRISDFLEGGELSANALNNELDYLTMSAQQLDDNQQAMLRFDTTEPLPNTILPSTAARAGKVLGFDNDGAPFLYDTEQTYAAPTYTQNGTGATPRSFAQKAYESVSVKDFGAVGNNTADDTTAIQNAIAAHDAVYFPPGTYRITAPLEIGDNKFISGAGATSIIKPSTNAYDTVSMIGSHAVLRDIVIDGGETGLRLYGKTAPCRSNIVENIILRNQSIGLEMDGYNNINNPCDGNTVRNVLIEHPAQYGVLVTRSGVGKYPNANKFHAVRVKSLGTSLSGAGFFIEAARYNNSLIDCEAYISGTPSACFRIGPESDKTLMINLYADGQNSVPNILIDNGAIETSIFNLYSNSTGAAILDYSGGNYLAYNAGYPYKTALNKTRISDLTTAQQRFDFETVAFATPNTVSVDLSKTTYMINAFSAVTTVQLPKAASGNSGAVVTIKKTDNSANAVLVTENTGNGPDNRTVRLGSQHDIVSVISDGATWRILSTNIATYNSNYIDGVTTYSPDITRQLHLISASAGICTVELPPANNATSIGRFLTIKKIDASANAVRVTESGATGPDNAMVSMTTRYAAVTVMSNGSIWHVIGKV